MLMRLRVSLVFIGFPSPPAPRHVIRTAVLSGIWHDELFVNRHVDRYVKVGPADGRWREGSGEAEKPGLRVHGRPGDSVFRS